MGVLEALQGASSPSSSCLVSNPLRLYRLAPSLQALCSVADFSGTLYFTIINKRTHFSNCIISLLADEAHSAPKHSNNQELRGLFIILKFPKVSAVLQVPRPVSNTLKALQVLAESSSPSSPSLPSSSLSSSTPRSSSFPPLPPTSSELGLTSPPSLQEHCGLHQPLGPLGVSVCASAALKGKVRCSGHFEVRRASSRPVPHPVSNTL